MARQRGVDTKIQVTRGFVTEFTPVGFPQEAAIDIDNCIIDTDGSIRRRPGLDLEKSFQLQQVGGGELSKVEIAERAFTTYLWEAVSGTGALNIIVQQIGTVLQFYTQMAALSENKLGELDLASFAVAGDGAVQLPKTNMEFTSGLGDLFVVNKWMESLRIEYDGVTTFTPTIINIQIRDFVGLDDGLDIDERPVQTTELPVNLHDYNLQNQGWTPTNIFDFAFIGGLHPSNADIMTVGLVVNSSGILAFDPSFITSDFLGNTPAPKGHFILDAFNQDYSSVSGISGLTTKVIATRPQAVAFLQGRVFYTAPTEANQTNGIFYSSQLITKDRAGLCFQEADPTASEINDLVTTDGGFLPTPGVGQIFRMQEFGNGVVCIASNGVWYLSGAEVGTAFSATSLRMEKIYDVGALGASSVVAVEGQLYFWGIDGIMQITLDDVGAAVITNLTQSTIQTFYVSISAASRKSANGVYIPEQRKVFWTYKDATAEVTPNDNSFNKILVLDLDIRGFYKYSLGEDDANNYPQVVGLTRIKPLVDTTKLNTITEVDGTVITDIALVNITTLTATTAGQASTLKLATMAFSVPDSGFRFTFSTFHSRDFIDWTVQPLGGLAMSSFVEFAEFNFGGVHTKGKPTYIHSFYATVSKNLEVGGYYELPAL